MRKKCIERYFGTYMPVKGGSNRSFRWGSWFTFTFGGTHLLISNFYIESCCHIQIGYFSDNFGESFSFVYNNNNKNSLILAY